MRQYCKENLKKRLIIHFNECSRYRIVVRTQTNQVFTCWQCTKVKIAAVLLPDWDKLKGQLR